MYHVHGIHRGGLLDEYSIGNDIGRVTLTTNIILGILLSLAVVSLLLFLLLHNYRPAFLFTLLCLGWFLHTGAMGSRAFITIAPWFTEPLRFRLMCIVTPLTPALAVPIIYDMFPGILPKNYVRGMAITFAAWVIFFQFADIGFILSHALWVCMGMAAVAVIYGMVMILSKVKKPDELQLIFIVGVLILTYSSVRDIFNYLTVNVEGFNFSLPPFDESNFARVGVIAFLLCLAASIFIATMRDMEKTKNEAQEISAKNAASENLAKMRRDYLADMSHEMNHPLTVVSVHVQQAARRYARSGGEDEIIGSSLLLAQKEIMNAAHIAKSSLKLATLQIDKDEKEVLETSSFLTNYLEGYRAIVERTGNKLTLNIPDNLPPVFVNTSQLGQVLMNLLTNAYTHTKNGVITVTAENKLQITNYNAQITNNNAQIGGVGFVTVSVSDSGTGIPPEMLAQVFERGVSSSGGTGLGLPISRDIIESHGGMLNIRSEPNKGMAATFTIPIAQSTNYKLQSTNGGECVE